MPLIIAMYWQRLRSICCKDLFPTAYCAQATMHTFKFKKVPYRFTVCNTSLWIICEIKDRRSAVIINRRAAEELIDERWCPDQTWEHAVTEANDEDGFKITPTSIRRVLLLTVTDKLMGVVKKSNLSSNFNPNTVIIVMPRPNFN